MVEKTKTKRLIDAFIEDCKAAPPETHGLGVGPGPGGH